MSTEYRIVGLLPNRTVPSATSWLSLDELVYSVRLTMLRFDGTIKTYTIEAREDEEDDNANR